jgi:hypothetical protein
MHLRKEILKEHSKAQCTKIVVWVGRDQQRFNELFRLFLHDEYRVVQRASWPLGYCVIAHPGFIKRHWKALITNLKKPGIHDSVKRNSIRLMTEIDIPGEQQGEIMDLCFRFLGSATEPLAVKVFSMSVLDKLAKEYPEIMPELRLMIEDQIPHQTAGFKSRAKKILRPAGKAGKK